MLVGGGYGEWEEIDGGGGEGFWSTRYCDIVCLLIAGVWKCGWVGGIAMGGYRR